MEAWREELYHYGMPKRSGRYPYGSGDRPFQGEGDAGVRKRKTLRQAVKDYRTKKHRQKAAAKARDAKKTKAEEDAKRASNMRNPAWLKRHFNELSNEEVKSATERLRIENELRSQSIRKINAGKEWIDMVIGYGKTGLDAYNTVTGIAEVIDKERNKVANKKKEEADKKKESELKRKIDTMSDDELKTAAEREKNRYNYINYKMDRVGKNKDDKKKK